MRPALTLTRRSAEHEVGFSLELVRRLPQVWCYLRRGGIDLRKARVLVNGVAAMSEPEARTCVAAVVDDAPDLPTGELRARLRLRLDGSHPAPSDDTAAT